MIVSIHTKQSLARKGINLKICQVIEKKSKCVYVTWIVTFGFFFWKLKKNFFELRMEESDLENIHILSN